MVMLLRDLSPVIQLSIGRVHYLFPLPDINYLLLSAAQPPILHNMWMTVRRKITSKTQRNKLLQKKSSDDRKISEAIHGARDRIEKYEREAENRFKSELRTKEIIERIRKRNEKQMQAANELDKNLEKTTEDIWKTQLQQNVEHIENDVKNEDAKKRLQQKRSEQKKKLEQQNISVDPPTSTVAAIPSQPGSPAPGLTPQPTGGRNAHGRDYYELRGRDRGQGDYIILGGKAIEDQSYEQHEKERKQKAAEERKKLWDLETKREEDRLREAMQRGLLDDVMEEVFDNDEMIVDVKGVVDIDVEGTDVSGGGYTALFTIEQRPLVNAEDESHSIDSQVVGVDESQLVFPVDGEEVKEKIGDEEGGLDDDKAVVIDGTMVSDADHAIFRHYGEIVVDIGGNEVTEKCDKQKDEERRMQLLYQNHHNHAKSLDGQPVPDPTDLILRQQEVTNMRRAYKEEEKRQRMKD
ncbi:hypothetical protein BBBOND_0310010 [Babesia bigemina]|uniref:Uncharacterized protein n=1 Tax=Babesia bigemina TaxID=5866 RepID=A0A061D976_BABBI|nr:hypothetical protein BBBOND_0310010 [Babesia bigemina]CDR97098.1 hypothetical protein BBBOND_0310010 [Babesia bigemina]|eukprot:XP_012769284.1 hypothetical protein BBBOND_0310010 [Babesia bigemina]